MSSFRIFRSVSFCVATSVLFSATVVSSATVTFDGQTDTDWNTASNWIPTAPNSRDVARVFGEVVEISGGSAIAGYIDVREAGTLNVTGGSLTFGFDDDRWMWVGLHTPGTVNQTGGIVASSGKNVDLFVDSFGTYNLTDGTLEVSDDLRLEGDAVFHVSGNSTVNIGDDLRVPNGSSVEFNVELIGDVAPIINVSGDLVLRQTTTLNIDSTSWTGADAITLFEVGNRVVRGFDRVTLDGIVVPPSQHQFSSGSMIIAIPEPTTLAMLATWLLVGMPIVRNACRAGAR